MPSTHALPPKAGHLALRQGRVSLIGQVYVVTTVTRHRVPWFTDFDAAAAAARCFTRTDVLRGHGMLTWVLMPDHVHWLLRVEHDEPLAALVNRLKSASARAANRPLSRHGPLWAPAFHDHAVRSDEALTAVAAYIVGNPIRAKLAARPGDYPFWDSIWLPEAGGDM